MVKYSPIIQDHFDNPRNTAPVSDVTHVSEAVNEACMDHLQLRFQVRGRTVIASNFSAQGCVPVFALGSWVATYAVGRTIDELKLLTPDQVEALVGGLPSTKKHAAHLVVEVLGRLD